MACALPTRPISPPPRPPASPAGTIGSMAACGRACAQRPSWSATASRSRCSTPPSQRLRASGQRAVVTSYGSDLPRLPLSSVPTSSQRPIQLDRRRELAKLRLAQRELRVDQAPLRLEHLKVVRHAGPIAQLRKL